MSSRTAPSGSAAASALFSKQYGAAPSVVASAPGRVNLIGEHTDYNGGEVLPIAIGRRTVVALAARDAGPSRVCSMNEAETGSFDPAAPTRAGRWWDYLAGVAAKLAEVGVEIPACDIAVQSEVPEAAGLSSSAALEVATGFAMTALVGVQMSPAEIALLCQRAESEFVGVACGIMDQFASALGRSLHALHLYCDTTITEQVPMKETVLIFDTGVPRSLRSSAFNVRRRECEEALALLRRGDPTLRDLAQATPDQIRSARLPDPLDRRALHVSEETRRVRALVTALDAGQPVSGELLLASHESLRTNYECSTEQLDWFVARMSKEPGVAGARLTGAGWGGCAIAVGDATALEECAPRVSEEYVRRFALQPRFWLTRAEDGARIDERTTG